MKTTLIALALLSGSAIAVPALAADSYNFDAGFYQTQLSYQGVNAIDVDDYSDGRLRAVVVLDDGSQVVEFFDKDSLQPVKSDRSAKCFPKEPAANCRLFCISECR